MPHPKIKIADNSGNEVAVTSNALDVNIAGGASIDIGDVEILGHSTLITGRNDTISDSTREQLNGAQDGSYSVACKHVDLMASVGNTGAIYVGDENVAASLSIVLYPGDVYSLDIDNLGDIWVLAEVDGENVQFIYYN
jgi:hypothetical protein